MNINLRRYTTLLLVLCCSCHKQDPYHAGTAAASKNGAPWQAECTAYQSTTHPGKFDMDFYVYNDERLLRQQLTIENITLNIGTDSVEKRLADSTNLILNTHPAAMLGYLQDDGDVPADFYQAINNKGSNIAITAYNAQTKTLTGTFDIWFARDTAQYIHVPDTLHFTNGTFTTRIMN